MTPVDAPPRNTATNTGGRNRARNNGNVVPHNQQAEQSLLGALLLSRDARDTVIGTLTPADFYKPAHSTVYQAIVDLYELDQPVDIQTVGDVLHRNNQLDDIGGHPALLELQTSTPSTTSVARYTKIVRDHALMRTIIAEAEEFKAAAYALPDDMTAIRRRVEQLLEMLDRSATHQAARPFDDVIDSWLEDMNRRVTGDRTAIPTGFGDLDIALGGGLHPGQLVVICGRTSMGKTAMAGSLALNIATANRPVLMCSIEMAELELADRWVAATANVELSAIRAANLNLGNWKAVDQATADLRGRPIWVHDHDDLTVSYLRGLARSLPQPPAVIIVDYLQLLRPGAKYDNRQEAVADISSSLKKLARRLQTPIVALAQLNRGAENRTDKRPMLSDLRESGSIENDSDVVIGLYREKYYKPANDTDVLEAIIMKQRSGPLQTVRLHFAGEISAVLNRADQETF